MKFWSALGGVAAAYALLNFAVIPRMQAAWTNARTSKKLAKVGVIAAMESLRNAAFLATIVFGAFGLFITLLGLFPGNSPVLLDAVFQRAVTVQGWLDRAKTLFGAWFVVVPIALLAVIAWRQRRDAVVRDGGAFVDAEQDRLNEERARDAGIWDDLPPSEAMRALDDKIAEDLKDAAGYTTDTTEGRSVRQRLLRRVTDAREQRRRIDYERRIAWETFDKDAPPRNARERWMRVLLSRGLMADLKGISKVLSRGSAAGVFLVMLGAASKTDYAAALQLRLVHLDELRVQLVREDAKVLRQRHPFVQPQQISRDDHAAVGHLSDQFARALLRNRAWHPFSAARTVSADGQRALLRRAILSETRLPTSEGTVEGVYAKTQSAASAAVDDVVHDLTANQTRLGERIAATNERAVVGWFGQRWTSMKAAALEHAALHTQPVGVEDLQRSLLDQLLSSFVDPLTKYQAPIDPLTKAPASNEFVTQINKALTDAIHRDVSEGLQTAFTQFLSDLESGVPLDAAVAHVEARRAPIPAGAANTIVEEFRKAGAPDDANLGERLTAERMARGDSGAAASADDVAGLSEPARQAAREGYR